MILTKVYDDRYHILSHTITKNQMSRNYTICSVPTLTRCSLTTWLLLVMLQNIYKIFVFFKKNHVTKEIGDEEIMIELTKVMENKLDVYHIKNKSNNTPDLLATMEFADKTQIHIKIHLECNGQWLQQ